eukprot:CAMPEP_0194142894 /NCGR_PEP_ID=MMETSP0152-20130528/12105_1 /TAXON_ID=1049557 /ORGANISM="Thalassiothrix antarctica, Strain L6-D1" /LENGTH=254 /DNA_ID=CAMNT_0038842041 /DNA_START=42 /DNA_END=806 /DNA_ORIENTATION=-
MSKDYIDSMANEHRNDAPIPTPASKAAPKSPVSGKNFTFSTDERNAYLSVPTTSKPKFSLLVIHEWWGLNDQIRSTADRFAGLGGVALAVDLYQTDAVQEPREARKLMKKAHKNKENILNHLKDACNYLKANYPNLSQGVIGWCFGGTWSLQLSLCYPMDATIIYYGQVVTEASDLVNLHGPVLGIFGALDKGIKVETAKEFESALEKAEKEHEIYIYEGAEHAFANPSGRFYNNAAAEEAWTKALKFINKNLT